MCASKRQNYSISGAHSICIQFPRTACLPKALLKLAREELSVIRICHLRTRMVGANIFEWWHSIHPSHTIEMAWCMSCLSVLLVVLALVVCHVNVIVPDVKCLRYKLIHPIVSTRIHVQQVLVVSCQQMLPNLVRHISWAYLNTTPLVNFVGLPSPLVFSIPYK